MADTYVTFQGWVGNEVTHRKVGELSVANFRVATTPRLKRKGEWVDGDTTWYSVSAWRSLADNVTESLKKGDAVIVHGRLRSEAWTREDGRPGTTLAVEASFVGHDLCRGTSSFTRSTRQDRVERDIHEELAEMIRQDAELETRVDSWGNPVGDAETSPSAVTPAEQYGVDREEPAA